MEENFSEAKTARILIAQEQAFLLQEKNEQKEFKIQLCTAFPLKTPEGIEVCKKMDQEIEDNISK